MAAVATAPNIIEAMAEYEGPPLLLTPERPAQTRTLVANVSVEEAIHTPADVWLMAQLTVTWKPTDPSSQTRPTLRWRLRSQDFIDPGPAPEPFNDVVIEQPTQQLNVSSDVFVCTLDPACEQRVLFTLELLPSAARGSLEVAWKMVATARPYDTRGEPKGFKLQLTELRATGP